MTAKKPAPKPLKMVATSAEAHKRLKTLAQQYHLTIGELVEAMAVYFSKSGIDPRYVDSAKSPEDATRIAIGKLESKVTRLNTSAWSAVQEVKKETSHLNSAVDVILKLAERLADAVEPPSKAVQNVMENDKVEEIQAPPQPQPEPSSFPSVERLYDSAILYKTKMGQWMAYVTKGGKESKRQFVSPRLITAKVAIQLTREGGNNTDLAHEIVNSMQGWEF